MTSLLDGLLRLAIHDVGLGDEHKLDHKERSPRKPGPAVYGHQRHVLELKVLTCQLPMRCSLTR